MRAGFYTFQSESTRIRASPKQEYPKETKDLYCLRNFFRTGSLEGFCVRAKKKKEKKKKNKAVYTATPIACGWAGAIIEVTGSFGQEL